MLRASTRLIKFSSQSNKTNLDLKVPLDRETIGNKLKNENKQVKVIKLNRKKISDLGMAQSTPEYADKNEYLTKTEAHYIKNIEQKIQQNLSTRRFYDYEMRRGQDLIDDIPIDPYYEYKIADLKMQIQERRKVVLELPDEEEDPQRLKKLKLAIANFQFMKHRYEQQQFLKKLKEYPGSQKGPNPQDDPAVYNQYINKIIPQSLKTQLSLKSRGKAIQIKNEEKELVGFASTNITDYLSQDRKVSRPKGNQKDDDFIEQVLQDIETIVNVVPYSDVPMLPNVKFEEYHTFLKKCELWQKFKDYYDRTNQKKQIQKLTKALVHADEKPKTKNKNKAKVSKESQPKIYSLYTYYKTLPKQIQQHPGVRTVYLGLQYSQPDATYEQKVQLLNQAAKMSLPMDKFSTAAMEELIKFKRKYLTPHLTDRIFNMNPEFTWDMKSFLREVKDQKLRSMSTVKEKQQSYPQPPELHKQWQEGMAVLPVDFYDNDDGFWTEHLDKKLQRYEKAQPLSRRHKKHLVH